MEEEKGVLYKYWSCPIKLIPRSVFSWLEKSEYEKEYKVSGLEYEKRPARFLQMRSYHKAKLSIFQKEVDRRNGLNHG